jgi:nitroimidazol reductase NimA-like FMN-containing flavoprotein (pyridoxamine 5'-phosphate oxidase superfamily)
MKQEEYKAAAEYWDTKDAGSIKMKRTELLFAVEAYIQSNNTCALATGSGSFVRCTPIEYTYREGAFWFFSEGGRKFVALEMNQNVCLAIFDRYEGFGKVKGMQVSGIAEMIEPYSKEYNEAAEYKKISIEALRKLSHPMNLIRVIPTRIDFLNSDFKDKGCANRQFIEF